MKKNLQRKENFRLASDFSKITCKVRGEHGAAFSRNLKKNKMPFKFRGDRKSVLNLPEVQEF